VPFRDRTQAAADSSHAPGTALAIRPARALKVSHVPGMEPGIPGCSTAAACRECENGGRWQRSLIAYLELLGALSGEPGPGATIRPFPEPKM